MMLWDKNFYCFCSLECVLSFCLIILQKMSSEIIIHAGIYISSLCLKITSSQKGTEGVQDSLGGLILWRSKCLLFSWDTQVLPARQPLMHTGRRNYIDDSLCLHWESCGRYQQYSCCGKLRKNSVERKETRLLI